MLRNAAGKVSWGGRAGFLTFGLAVMAALVAGILVLMTLFEPAEAAFPGANGRIAFTSNRTGNFEIFRMDSDGDNPINLTLTSATDDRSASYSANGKKIVFDSGDLSNNQEIYSMNASSLLQTRLTRNSIFDVEPAYSSDGKTIVFTTNRDSDSEIYRMSVADTNHDGQGDNPRNLTDISGQDSDPVYSPNKAKIAFQSNRDTNAEIYVMNATAGEPQVNLTQNVATDFEASWQALP